MARVLTAQPFPFYHYDLEAQEFLPCGITASRYVQGTPYEMMRLYWRVKQFGVTGSYTNYVFNDPTQPRDEFYDGTATSLASIETDLVCNPGFVSLISVEGERINGANFIINFVGSNFYYNSDPNTTIVKLYGELDFYTDADDAGSISTSASGNLAPFVIDGFQVYENESPVYYSSSGNLITDFTASIVAQEFWSYDGLYDTMTGINL